MLFIHSYISHQQAIESFVQLNRRGLIVSFGLYPEAVNALHDDIEEVREQGLELITLLATLYPNRVVTHSGSQLPLVEDAFGKICNAVRDHVVSVRTKACRMLGKLKGIKETLLLEGFGKIELEYTPKYNRRRAREEEDASIKKKAIQQKQMIMEDSTDDYGECDGDISIKGTEKDALLYSGAVGTFVLALEDQYRSVRMAIIESICELNRESEAFSRKSVDYLIEMFNDEIDSVRIHAIDSVSKINATSLRFDEEQLQIVLAILEDYNVEIRTSIRNLLSVIVLSNARCLHAAIRALLINNMRKYRADTEHIYTCLRDLAKNHSKLTEFLIEELLRLERYIMPTEYKVDDEYYTGLCIVIFNASENNPKIPNHLPKYMFKHYAYLRSKLPHLFPDLKIRTLNMQSNTLSYTFSRDDVSQWTESKKLKLSTTLESEALILPFIQTLNQVRALALSNEREEPLQAITTLRKELNKTTKSVDKKLNVFVQFLKLYTSCCQQYLTILQNSNFDKLGSNTFKNIIYMTYRIEKMFDGLTNNILLQLMYIRFVVYAKYFVFSSEKGSNNGSDSVIQKLRELAGVLQSFCDANGTLNLNESISRVVSLLIQKQPISTVELASMTYFPTLDGSDVVKMDSIACTITSPQENMEKPIEFQPFVSLPLTVEAKLRGISLDQDKLFINVSFPDGTHAIFPIDNAKDVSKAAHQSHYVLSKEISLRTEWWSEACQIEISITSSYSTQVSDEYSLLSQMQHCGDTSNHLIALCKSVPLLIFPKLK